MHSLWSGMRKERWRGEKKVDQELSFPSNGCAAFTTISSEVHSFYKLKKSKNQMKWRKAIKKGDLAKKNNFNKMADIIRLVTRASNSFLDINSVAVDNWTFKLFYKFSVILLISCSVLVASKQFFGGPITCDAGMVKYQTNLLKSDQILNPKFHPGKINSKRWCSKILLLDVCKLQDSPFLSGSMLSCRHGYSRHGNFLL